MKRTKKVLSLILCLAMVMAFLPTSAFASLVDPGNKAKLEVELLKSANAGTFVPLSATDIKNFEVGQTFMVGIKMKNFKNISESQVEGSDGALATITFGVDYRSDLLEMEPTAGEDSATWGEELLIGRLPADSFYNHNRGYDAATNSNLYDDSIRTGTGEEWKMAYVVTEYSSLNSTNTSRHSSYHCDKDEYVAIFEFKIKAIPAAGCASPVYFSENNTKFTLAFGNNADQGCYQHYAGGPTDQANDMHTIIDYDANAAKALFPKQQPNIEGTVTLDKTAPIYGETITATANVTTPNPGTLSYKWYKGNTEIAGQTTSTLTVTKDMVGGAIKAEVSASDCKGQLTSAATTAVAKKGLDVTAGSVKIKDKVYDGKTTGVVLASQPTITGAVAGDTLGNVTISGSYGSANVGDAVAVTGTLSLSTNDAKYYKLNDASVSTTGKITPKAVEINNISNIQTKINKTDATMPAVTLSDAALKSPADFDVTYAVKNDGGTGIALSSTGTVTTAPTAEGNATVTATVNLKNTNYSLAAATKDFTIEVKDKVIDGVTIKTQPTKKAYDKGDTLDLSGLEVELSYDNGEKETVALADFAAKGIAVTPADGATLDTVGTTTITVTANSIPATTTVTVAAVVEKVDPTITITNLNQTVKQVRPLNVVVTPKDDAATYTVEIEVDVVDTPAVECTCPAGEDGTVTHDPTNTECHKADAVTHKEYVAWDAADVNNLAIGSYPVRVNYTGGTTTKDATKNDTLTLKAPSTGGGGSSAITVTFKAGTNGKITDGKASVSVNRNAQLTKANIPTVTANDGFKFLGWSLDGKTVVDPTEAKVTKSITYTALYEAVKGGHETYMFGYADGTFQPNAQITRAEAAALIARLNPDYDLTANYTGTLKDLPVGAWFTKVVNFNVEKGFITGYTDGTFKPNNAITRQEFCTIVAKYLGLENTGEAKFTDTKGVYAEGFIAQLVEKNIVSGYNDGSFKPNANITRAEATRILNGVFGRTPNKETVDAHIAEYTVNLKDVPATHWAYYEILEAAVNHTPADFHK